MDLSLFIIFVLTVLSRAVFVLDLIILFIFTFSVFTCEFPYGFYPWLILISGKLKEASNELLTVWLVVSSLIIWVILLGDLFLWNFLNYDELLIMFVGFKLIAGFIFNYNLNRIMIVNSLINCIQLEVLAN